MKFKDQDLIEIRFSGSGGQGLVLASILLGEALMEEGYNVFQGESHGIEARGGASRGELIARKGEIYDLLVKTPDIFVAISQEACTKFHKQIKKNALVIIDSFLVKEIPIIDSENAYAFPITKLLQEKLNTTLPTNIACLGALVGLTDIVAKATMVKAILNRVPKGSEEVNLKAFALGWDLAKEAKPLRQQA